MDKNFLTNYDGSSKAIQFVDFNFTEEINPGDIENKKFKIL
jgi:hypothetical protein